MPGIRNGQRAITGLKLRRIEHRSFSGQNTGMGRHAVSSRIDSDLCGSRFPRTIMQHPSAPRGDEFMKDRYALAI